MFVQFVGPASGSWTRCVDIVRERYALDYGATVDPTPTLFVMLTPRASDTSELAVAGLTFGSHDRPLFCEHYLPAPAERVAAPATERPNAVSRVSLVEVGPLVSSKPGLGRRLIDVLPGICWCRGSTAIVFTVTRPVVALIKSNGIPVSVVGEATLDDLPEEQRSDWGRYYDYDPVVGVVDLTRFGAELTPRETSSSSSFALAAGPISPEERHVLV